MAEHWYALKVFFNKVFEMEDFLNASGYVTYLATDKVLQKGMAHLQARKKLATLEAQGKKSNIFIVEGAQIFKRVPMVTSLLFVKAPREDLPEIDQYFIGPDGQRSGFIYKSADKKDFFPIPDAQMETFRIVTSNGSEGLEIAKVTDFQQGNRVRVKEGPFKGAEGYIKRIRRERRLLVCIQGVIAVVTSYIPPEMLEIVPEE